MAGPKSCKATWPGGTGGGSGSHARSLAQMKKKTVPCRRTAAAGPHGMWCVLGPRTSAATPAATRATSYCRDPGSNRGPPDLLPAELSRHLRHKRRGRPTAGVWPGEDASSLGRARVCACEFALACAKLGASDGVSHGSISLEAACLRAAANSKRGVKATLRD